MKHIISLLFALACTSAVYAQKVTAEPETIDARWFKSHYSKAEYMVPMRDGTKLYTAVFTPKNKKRLHPILLNPTQNGCAPYGKKSATFWQEQVFAEYLFAEYVFVFQDERGSGKSAGELNPATAATDLFDTADFLLRKVRKNNGNIGVWGIAEDCAYAMQAAACNHPAIKAVSVQAPAGEDIAEGKVCKPILFVGGSFDEVSGEHLWANYRAVKKTSPLVDCRLAVGAWTHGAWRSIDDNAEGEVADVAEDATPQFYSAEIEFPFFEHYLQGAESSGATASGELIYFTGEDCWREMDGVCQEGADSLTLYLNEEGALYKESPWQKSSYSLVETIDSNSGNTLLTFTSPVLDSDVTAVGGIEVVLYVKTKQTASDFVINIIDITDNDESEMLVRRASVVACPTASDDVTMVRIKSADCAHTFLAGHRIKIEVGGATEKEKASAETIILHEKSRSSFVLFPLQ